MNTNSKEKLNKTPIYKQAIIIFMVILLVLPIFTWQTTLSDSGTTSALWNGNQAAGYQSGNGTAGSPYIIMTAEQLAYFSNQSATYANTYFKLGQNILVNNMNAERTAFSGTVRLFTPKSNFQGVFDGDGCEIIGLSIEAGYSDSGLVLFRKRT